MEASKNNKNDEINIFVGIDPSLNSTGVAIWIKENDFYHLYNIRSKQTKKEASLIPSAGAVSVILYEHTDAGAQKEDHHKFELIKTENIINITKEIKNILLSVMTDAVPDDTINVNLHVCVETNAYSAGARSVSLVELSGLNFLIRYTVLNFNMDDVDIDVELICATPAEIKKYATGRGDADKELMLYCFSLLQPEICTKYSFMKLDDLADAHFMMLFAYNIYNKIYNKLYNKETNSEHSYSDEQEKLISDKINVVKTLKKQQKSTIKNYKHKKDVWDTDMMQFADEI